MKEEDSFASYSLSVYLSRHHHSTWLVSGTGWNGRDHIVGGPGQLLNPTSSSLLLFYANFARFEAEHEVQLY